MKKKVLSILLTMCLVLTLAPLSAFAADGEVLVILSAEGVTVDAGAVSTDPASAVYLKKEVERQAEVEEGSELAGLENSVITITKAGTYRFSGTISDAQIAVSAAETDEVTIILDGVDITCRTAPAIMVYSAKETNEAGKGAVTIYLAEGSVNKVTGSHTVKITDDDIKHDAAVSSRVSLVIDGPGALDVVGDLEGVEVKYKHLTINNGVIHIKSADDPINGSEDGVAHITINGGYIFTSAELGVEGDGIDSNGYITINGGTVIALAHPTSMDSGLDSDNGTVINGGTVVGAGNMYDPLEDTSEQLFMLMQFSTSTDSLIVVTDENDSPIFAYDFPSSFSYISFSTPELAEGTYHVYIGGSIEGTESDGLWTGIKSYEGGEMMRHGGASEAGQDGMMGAPPADGMAPPEGMEGMEPPEGMGPPPDGMAPPEGMEGMTPPEGMEAPPEGMAPPGGMGGLTSSSEAASYDFVLTMENKVFTNVTSASLEESIEASAPADYDDVASDAWYYEGVMKATEEGLMNGVTETTFNPGGAMNRVMLVTVLYRLAGSPEVTFATAFSDVSADAWYYQAIAWAADNGIVDGYEDGSFKPLASVTREQLANMLYNYSVLQDYDTATEYDISLFTDSDNVRAYAADAMKWAVGKNLIEGTDGMLLPGNTATRAQVAAILVRYIGSDFIKADPEEPAPPEVVPVDVQPEAPDAAAPEAELPAGEATEAPPAPPAP